MAANTQRSGTKRSTNARAKPKKSAPASRRRAIAIHEQPLARLEQRAQHDRAQLEAEHVAFDGEPQQDSSSNNGHGVIDTVKSAAGKAAAPAAAVGAAAIGIAGGIALKSRTRRKTVLGVKMPRSIGKSLPDIDAKSIAKSVGHASKQFTKTSKGVSKDLKRAGDQAERIGKILD